MSTFNGWPIITLPSSPAPRSIEWEPDDVVGASKSPFNLSQQTYQWQQAIIRASVSYPPVDRAVAAQWRAFLAQTQGITAVFLFGDPDNTRPQSALASGGTVTGSGQTGYTLNCSATNMTPGDWISIGLRLYMVTSQDSGSLGIWPNLRESPADGTDIVTTNTQGLFRLMKNQRAYTLKPGGIYSFTFEIEEAL